MGNKKTPKSGGVTFRCLKNYLQVNYTTERSVYV